MNTVEPVVVGTGRYRVHSVRSGFHVCFQSEWQKDYKTLRRERLRTKEGTILEFFALPCWQASAHLFDNEAEAKAFALAALEAEIVVE